jgi:hypothetical protein
MSQLGLQLVKAWFSQPCRAASYDARHCATYAVLCVAVLGDQILHALGHAVARTPHGQKLIYLFACNRVDQLEVLWVCGCGGVFGRRRKEEFVSNRVGKGNDLDSVGFAQVLFCYGTGCYATWVVLALV